MNKLNTMFYLLSLLISTNVGASTPITTKVPVENVFSPRGYDTLDSSEIVIEGILPNGCHRVPKTTYSIKGTNIFVEVTSLVYQQPNTFCPEIILPFIKTIDLGVLSKGKYKVFVNEGTNLERKTTFQVRDPLLGEDKNQIYANVEYIEKNRENNKVTLYGHNPSSCFVLDKIRVVDNGRSTLSILPRMKKVSDWCPMKMVPFKFDVSLPTDISNKETLIHVRTMYGNSVNTLY
jgi:hypothetical protein